MLCRGKQEHLTEPVGPITLTEEFEEVYMTRLNAEVKFGAQALAKLNSEGNNAVTATSGDVVYDGTPKQLRDFFRMAALPKAFDDALDQAEQTVTKHTENRGFLGGMVDAVAIAGAGIIGYPLRALMEDSKAVEGYPDAVVTVRQPGF